MRIPLGVNLESRDGGVDKDARVVNGVVEVKGEVDLRVRKRPGFSDVGLVKAGTAQLLYSWNGLNTIQGDYLNRGTISTIVSSPTQTNLSPTTAGIRWDAADTGANASTPYMMIKNRTQAKYVNQAGTVAAITYGGTMGLNTYNLVSLTRSGTTATGTLASTPSFNVGDSVTIAGADQTAYNGVKTITAVTPGSFTTAQDIPITITRSGTTATATTVSGNHGLTTATAYTISGANQSEYNGSKTITVTSSTTFTYTVTVTGQGPDTDLPITITRAAGSTTATATSATAHGLTSGWTVTIAGCTQTAYNGAFVITVTSAMTFTYTVSVTAEAPVSPATGSPVLANQSWSASGTCFNDEGTPDYNAWNASTSAHGFSSGDSVTVSNPFQSDINGTYSITVTGSNTFTFRTVGWANGPAIRNNSVFSVTRTAPAVSSITRSGSTATITTATAHNFSGSHGTSISGATQTQYNKSFTPTITGANTMTYSVIVTAEQPTSPATGSPIVQHTDPLTPATGTIIVTRPSVTVNSTFTYTVAGSPTTPATGTITATTNGGTVPGIPYIDGYFCVMDINGVIWNSDSDDPTTWGALNFITAQAVNGAGKALARSQNYLIALKEWSTEYFWDADNPSGSPFAPVQNGFTQIGCASGDSVAQVDGSLLWVSQVRERGRAVHMLTGLQMQPVSTPDIERILGNDDFATVYAYGLKINGHPLYILTLVTSGITLVYDLKSQIWGQWSSLTIGSSKSVSSITRVGTTATVTTSTAHGLSDGDPVKISGANQNEYNTIFQARVVSTTVFTVEVGGSPTTPATGTILAWPYTESYFKFTKYADCQGLNLFLHESDGHLYRMVNTLYQDAGVPIDMSMRTVRLDGGSTEIKKMSRVIVVGDRVVDDGVNNLIMIRWSDDDYTTNSAYRLIDLSLDQPKVRKCGGFRRRSIELRYTGNAAPAIQALELDVER